VIDDYYGAMFDGEMKLLVTKIGGSRHMLLFSISLASEVNGARHYAWSQAAKRENYKPGGEGNLSLCCVRNNLLDYIGLRLRRQ
jgi:hypothetical protein